MSETQERLDDIQRSRTAETIHSEFNENAHLPSELPFLGTDQRGEIGLSKLLMMISAMVTIVSLMWSVQRFLNVAAEIQIDATPADPLVAKNVEAIALYRKDPQSAIASFEKMAGETPKHATVANNLGVAYLASGQMAEAEESLLKAVDIEPANASFQNNLASVYIARGRFENALMVLNRITDRESIAREYYLNLGILNEKQRQWKAAAGAYDRYIGSSDRNDPRWPWVSERVRIIRGLANSRPAHDEMESPMSDREEVRRPAADSRGFGHDSRSDSGEALPEKEGRKQ